MVVSPGVPVFRVFTVFRSLYCKTLDICSIKISQFNESSVDKFSWSVYTLAPNNNEIFM